MAKKREDLPIVSGRLEDLILDIKESWSKWGWLFVTLNFVVAMIVMWDVLKKRFKKGV